MTGLTLSEQVDEGFAHGQQTLLVQEVADKPRVVQVQDRYKNNDSQVVISEVPVFQQENPDEIQTRFAELQRATLLT